MRDKANWKKSVKYVAGVSALVLVIALLSIMVATGRLLITTKKPSDKLAKIPTICTQKDVVIANDFLAFGHGETQPKTEALYGLVDNIARRSGYETDYTCLDILALGAQYQNDVPKMYEIAEQMRQLEEDGNTYMLSTLHYHTSANSLIDNARRIEMRLEDETQGQ